VTRLLQWLATAPGATAADAASEMQQRSGAWLMFLMVPVTVEDRAAADGQRAPWLPQLPLHIREPGPGMAPVMSKPGGALQVVGWWPMALAKGLSQQPGWTAPAAVLLDATAAPDEDSLHGAWRRWLQVFNTLQFLTGTCLVTADGLQAHDYDGLMPAGEAVAPAKPATQAALNAAWQSVVDQAMGPLAAGLRQLAKAGAEPPEVGLELADAKGRVLADCELAWAAHMLAVLRADQGDLADLWRHDGWQAVVLDETDDGVALVAGIPWAKAVADAMKLDLKTEEGGAA
jgi:DEAD/DEAH box helicase domain-containing protein